MLQLVVSNAVDVQTSQYNVVPQTIDTKGFWTESGRICLLKVYPNLTSGKGSKMGVTILQ